MAIPLFKMMIPQLSLLLFASSLFSLPSLALRVTKNQNYPAVQGRFTAIETFDYLSEGSMKVEWLGSSDTEIKDLGFFLCSREELQHFKSRMKSKDWFTDYCRHSTSSTHSSHYSQNYRKWNPSSSAAKTCTITMKNFMDPLLLNYTISSSERYTLGLVNCAPCGYSTCQFSKSVRLKYSLVNPSSELSSSDFPLLIVYPVYAGVWFLAFLVFLVVILKVYYDSLRFEEMESLSLEEIARQRHGAYRFHALFLFVAFSKLSVEILLWAYWYVFSKNGDRDSVLRVAANVSYSFSECFVFCVLLLLAHGWCVLVHLNTTEVRALSSSLLALFSSLLFFSFYDVVTSLLVLYVFLLPNIFSNLSQNIDYLRFRISWVESVEDQIEEEDHEVWAWTLMSLNTKLNTYTTIRYSIAFYFVFHFAVELSPFWLPWYLEYLAVIFQEALILFFVLFIFWMVAPFRAKDGLFWVPSFAGDQENHSAWLDATQRAFDQTSSEEHQERLNMVSFYGFVSKHLQLVQYFTTEGKKEEGEEKEEESDEGRVRNVYLASKLGWNVSLPLEEGRRLVENVVENNEEYFEEEEEDEEEAEEGTPLISSSCS